MRNSSLKLKKICRAPPFTHTLLVIQFISKLTKPRRLILSVATASNPSAILFSDPTLDLFESSNELVKSCTSSSQPILPRLPHANGKNSFMFHASRLTDPTMNHSLLLNSTKTPRSHPRLLTTLKIHPWISLMTILNHLLLHLPPNLKTTSPDALFAIDGNLSHSTKNHSILNMKNQPLGMINHSEPPRAMIHPTPAKERRMSESEIPIDQYNPSPIQHYSI